MHFKKSRRAEGGATIFGVFHVKNHDFTQKNHIFSILGGVHARCAPDIALRNPFSQNKSMTVHFHHFNLNSWQYIIFFIFSLLIGENKFTHNIFISFLYFLNKNVNVNGSKVAFNKYFKCPFIHLVLLYMFYYNNVRVITNIHYNKIDQ